MVDHHVSLATCPNTLLFWAELDTHTQLISLPELSTLSSAHWYPSFLTNRNKAPVFNSSDVTAVQTGEVTVKFHCRGRSHQRHRRGRATVRTQQLQEKAGWGNWGTPQLRKKPMKEQRSNLRNMFCEGAVLTITVIKHPRLPPPAPGQTHSLSSLCHPLF